MVLCINCDENLGRRKVLDTESVRQGNCSIILGVVRLGFVGQLPCRTTSVSDNFLHLENFRKNFDLWDHFWPLAKKNSNKVKWARLVLFCMHFYRKIICIFFYLGCYLTHFEHEKGSNKKIWARIMTFCIDFILGFDYFKGVSEKSWVLTILKG